MYKPGKEKATRIEYPFSRPGLQSLSCFRGHAGCRLKGIEKGYELPPPVEEDIYEMSEAGAEKARNRITAGKPL